MRKDEWNYLRWMTLYVMLAVAVIAAFMFAIDMGNTNKGAHRYAYDQCAEVDGRDYSGCLSQQIRQYRDHLVQ